MAEAVVPGEHLADQDIQRLAVQATAACAEELRRQGIDAWAKGTTLYSKRGKQLWVMHNSVSRGVPGTRERMLNTWAGMVVANLLKAASS